MRLVLLVLLALPAQAEPVVIRTTLVNGLGFSETFCFYADPDGHFILWIERTPGEPCAPYLDFPVDDLDSVPVQDTLPGVP